MAATPILLCVGDSITEYGDAVSEKDNGPGWLALLRSRLWGRAHVLNYGVSGYNTVVGRGVLSRALDEQGRGASCVILFYGANDAVNGGQHVSENEYKINLTGMVDEVREKAPQAGILLVTPPALCDVQRVEYLYPEKPVRSANAARRYATICQQVAQQVSVPCVNICTEMETSANTAGVRQYLCDGLHLNTSGNAFLEAAIVRTLDAHVPKFAPTAMTRGYVLWEDLFSSKVQ